MSNGSYDPLRPLKIFDGNSTDTYQYLPCPNTTVVNVQISNAAIYIGYGVRLPGQGGSAIYPDNDEPLLPVIGSIDQVCDEIRIKSYTPGSPAQVKIRAK